LTDTTPKLLGSQLSHVFIERVSPPGTALLRLVAYASLLTGG